MGDNRTMCKAPTDSGGVCPHYAIVGREYCARHQGHGRNLDRECARDGCDRVASFMSGGWCRFHEALAVARGLTEQSEVEDLIEALRDVTVRTPEQREQSQARVYLDLIRRSVEDITRYSQIAEQYGATREQLTEAARALNEAARALNEGMS